MALPLCGRISLGPHRIPNSTMYARPSDPGSPGVYWPQPRRSGWTIRLSEKRLWRWMAGKKNRRRSVNRKHRMQKLGTRLAGLLLLTASAAVCQSNDIQGWTRIKWGMTVSEAREAFQGQVSDPRVATPPDAILVDRFIVTGLQIGRITAEAAVQTERDSNQVVAVRIRATSPIATGLARTSTYSTLKHLLITKYGTPQNEDHSPYGSGGTDSRVLWLFPSTSITLRWSEMGNGESGFVTIRYEALDRTALDAL